jgi:2-phospho-L-lactate transferase/gluconeogenesis factor (CofD/UPF0052 family)
MQKAGIVALAPSALIPTLGPIICIGLVGAALFKLLKDDDLDSEPVNDEESSSSIDSSSTRRLEESADAIDSDQFLQAASDLEKQEMIRQAMSELGKRSGAARAKKAGR